MKNWTGCTLTQHRFPNWFVSFFCQFCASSCTTFLKCGNLNLLGPSGPVQGCNGIDLPYNLLCLCLTVLYFLRFIPVTVLYGCETWSLTLREELGWGKWRKINNEELNDLYCSPNIVQVIKLRRMRWIWHVAWIWEERVLYRVSVCKPERKTPPGRPRHRWEDNIKMHLQEVGCGSMDWIGLAQDRNRWRAIVNVVMNLQVPLNAGNFLSSCEPVSFSTRIVLCGVSK
jgi:hypothetical protein